MPKNSEHFRAMFSPASLRLAWERYIRAAQREAKDYLGMRAFAAALDRNLADLSKTVLAGGFSPSRPPKFFMPKSSGMQRSITILPVADALVFQAVADHVATSVFDVLAENNAFVFGSVLHDEVKFGSALLDTPGAEFYFFKPWQVLYKEFADSVNKAVREEKVEFKFETDITGFYDAIPHYNLLVKTADMSGVADDVLDLLSDCLNVWSGTRDRATPGVGIPQATGSSHFFANLFLHDLDDLVRDQGLPYYRYMDDMRIYGYTKEDLHRVLVKIDRHLKQHALSLNAKKTSIEEIVPETEADAIIEFQYNPALAEPQSGDAFVDTGDQDGSGYQGAVEGVVTGSRRELIELCRRDIEEAKNHVAEVASKHAREKIRFDDRKVQRDFMRRGFLFRQAVHILKQNRAKPRLPKGKTLEGWIRLAEQYFWFTHQFCWVLRLYEDDPQVKKRMLAMLDKYSEYEWVQWQVYQCLALSQHFTAKELRGFFSKLTADGTWYAKRGIYLLLLLHSTDRQLFRSILARAGKEEDVLKREILFMAGLWEKNGIGREMLMEALGLT